MAQRSLIVTGNFPFKLKPVSKFFLVAEALDILTTFIGLAVHPQMWEANPIADFLGGIPQVALLKLLVTLTVVLIIEKVDRWPRLIWIVPLMASTPVVWNLFSIWVEFIYAPETLAVFSILGELK